MFAVKHLGPHYVLNSALVNIMKMATIMFTDMMGTTLKK